MKRTVCFLAVLLLAGFTAGLQAEEGLRVSILGDSYSTFKDCNPRGVYYYPGNGTDVSKAEECWWHIVIRELYGTLEVNDSWSGSCISFTGYHGKKVPYSSFVARTLFLGEPDLILICGGTNDSWAGVKVGEYRWEDFQPRFLYTFRPAMAKMLADVRTLYPQAKVYFILNCGLREDIQESVHTVCRHYQIPCIDLKDIDKQNNHPSVAGMKAFASQVLDVVKKDFPASLR